MWYEQQGAGGEWAEPDGITFMTIRTTLKSQTRLFLAWQDEQPVGGGALEIHEGVAALMAADTLPGFRNRGIHTALMQVGWRQLQKRVAILRWFMAHQVDYLKAIF